MPQADTPPAGDNRDRQPDRFRQFWLRHRTLVVPASVTLHWKLDGHVVPVTREIEILAHEGGFRVWDGWRPTSGNVSPGNYQVELRTAGQRTFGRAAPRVER